MVKRLDRWGEMMRLVFLAVLISCVFSIASPSWAETPQDTALSQKLSSLSQKVDDLKKQNQSILANQAKILQEIQVLKVRIRRS